MPQPTNDVWEVLSTARSIRRFADEPVDDQTLDRCLEAATWEPDGTNAQLWRFIVLDLLCSGRPSRMRPNWRSAQSNRSTV